MPSHHEAITAHWAEKRWGFDYYEHIHPYQSVGLILDDMGYVAWRLSPGETVELLHLKASEPRKGYGTRLLRRVVESLPPNCTSLYGFTRLGSIDALAFYRALGFDITEVPNLYGPGAVCFSAPLDCLRDMLQDTAAVERKD